MNLSIEDDRLAHLLMSGNGGDGYDQARRKLDRAALVLSADASNAAVGAGGAADRGGVRRPDVSGWGLSRRRIRRGTVVGQFRGWPMRRHLELAGCRTTIAPEHAVALHVGSGPLQYAAADAGPTAGRR